VCTGSSAITDSYGCIHTFITVKPALSIHLWGMAITDRLTQVDHYFNTGLKNLTKKKKMVAKQNIHHTTK